jgi:hypothetical protein
MPTRTIKRPAARKTRSGAHAGKNKKGQGRKAGSRTAPPAPAILANSIFALTLKDKPGIEVSQKLDGKMRRSSFDAADDYERMHADLSQACYNARKILGQNPSKPDLLASGCGIGIALTFVTGVFESSVLPVGYSYSIDRDHNSGEYFFTVFDTCDYKEYWHAFELRPVIEHLKATDIKLHNFFLLFIKSFMVETSIYAWWNGGCHYAQDFLEEEILNWEDNYEGVLNARPDDEYLQRKAQAIETLKSYTTGYVFRYQNRINKNKILSVPALEKKLKRFNSRNRIVQWMKAACKFMARPAGINTFINYEVFEAEMNGEGMEFDGHASIIWDWDDAYTYKHMEFLDSESQSCGVMPPVVSIRIEKKTNKIDFESLKAVASWPLELNDIWNHYHGIAESLKPRKDERTDATIEVDV